MDGKLLRALHAVRRRLRYQAAFDLGARCLVLAAANILVAVYLWRLGYASARALGLVAAGAVALVLGPALVAALRPIPLARVAKRIDRSHGLHDRLGSALVFGADPRA